MGPLAFAARSDFLLSASKWSDQSPEAKSGK